MSSIIKLEVEDECIGISLDNYIENSVYNYNSFSESNYIVKKQALDYCTKLLLKSYFKEL